MSEVKGTDALDYIRDQYGDDPDFAQGTARAHTDLMVGKLIYDARQEAGMTQKELAKLVGTTQSVISRLEQADYDGHSLPMLNRIAAALHKKLQIQFVCAANESKGVIHSVT